jgi:OFA family oxalate/formate antiporter-like MFS transporter
VEETRIRYIILAASCAAIFWPGTLVFGFPGVMSGYWQSAFDVNRADVGRIMFFVLSPVGFFMFFFGKLLERLAPAKLIATGGALAAASTFLLPRAGSFNGVCLWAFVMGSATAMIYLTGLTVTQQWFPGRRGLVSGVYNLCFGASAALLAPLYGRWLSVWGYERVTHVAAVSLLVFVLTAALIIRFPRPQTLTTGNNQGLPGVIHQAVSMSVGESLKTRSFWFLWCAWAFAGAAGISMVPLATTLGKARGLPLGEAVVLLTAFNTTNGASRLVSGFISDFIGRKITLAVSFLLAGIAYFLLSRAGSPTSLVLLTAVIGYAFGTLFAVSAPLVGDCFGMAHFGAIIGVVFTAYGFVSGVIGPWLCGHLLDLSGGNFGVVFPYLGTLYILAAVMIMLTRPRSECVLPVS